MKGRNLLIVPTGTDGLNVILDLNYTQTRKGVSIININTKPVVRHNNQLIRYIRSKLRELTNRKGQPRIYISSAENEALRSVKDLSKMIDTTRITHLKVKTPPAQTQNTSKERQSASHQLDGKFLIKGAKYKMDGLQFPVYVKLAERNIDGRKVRQLHSYNYLHFGQLKKFKKSSSNFSIENLVTYHQSIDSVLQNDS